MRIFFCKDCILNKHLITNITALLITAIGFVFSITWLFSVGIFALSGALTNWLAVHMLFEKIPGLYGSGVIPNQFTQIKEAIKQLFLDQFFTQDNIDKLLANKFQSENAAFDLKPLIDNTDLTPAYNSLITVVEQSQFGSMLGMFGGTSVLEPLKQPFIEKMQGTLVEISSSESFKAALSDQLAGSQNTVQIQQNIMDIIDVRLAELTPELVKQLMQNLIKSHLGWLVVWGGVLGGLFGLIAYFLKA
jgi:uncharacterized membrane protein YheB (UPF0754 family)